MRLTKISLIVAMSMQGLCSCAMGETLNEGKMDMKETINENEVFADPQVVELAKAVSKGNVEKIEYLASAENINARGRDDVTLLEWATMNKKQNSLEALLKKGADPSLHGVDGETVLHLAAQMDNPAFLRLLLANKVNPNLLAKDGSSALVNALHAEQRGNLKTLLDAGANPNQTDIVGTTPLHVAAKIYDYESVMILLESGANPRAVNRAGFTFQRYLAPDENVPLNANGKRKLAVIHSWLTANGVEIEGGEK